MYKINLISKNTETTKSIGCKLASMLTKGDVVVLTGELGAGKTKFVEGFLEFFNLQDEISSPTFNIVNEYLQDNSTVYHFDVYRLEDSDEFYAIGGDEYFEKGICLIEWGELILDALPEDYIHITINKNHDNENERSLEFKVNDNSKYKNILDVLINENF